MNVPWPGEKMAQDQTTRNPGAALTRFVAFTVFTALFWWADEQGWPGAWFMVYLMGIAALFSFFDVLRAHRAWTDAHETIKKAQKPSERYDTRPKGGGGPPADGWE